MPPRRIAPKAKASSKADAAKNGKNILAGAGRTILDAATKAQEVKSVPDLAGQAPELKKEDMEEKQALAKVLDKLFEQYYTAKHGEIERIEFLEGEEKRLGRLNFGPRQRREAVAWFKEAGAEGTPVTGMYVAREKWDAAVKKLAAEAVGAVNIKGQAQWIFENRLKALLEANLPKEDTALVPKDAGAGQSAEQLTASGVPPAYPLKIGFKDIAERIKEARAWNKSVLLLASGLSEVETYLTYQHMGVVDAKLYINEVYVKKAMTQDDARAEVRRKLAQCMQNESGFCKPVHVRLSNSAFDFVKFCSSGVVPQDVFNPDEWTPEAACKKGFIDDAHVLHANIEDQKRWKDFHIVISSSFDLETAKEHLTDKIPHFDKLAILEVQPNSIEKGP